MSRVYALQQRQQRKRKPLTTAEFAFAEPTQLFAPGAFTSASLLPSEGQEHPTQVAQFRHAFDQIPINSPVSSYEAEQSAMQQTGTQLSPVQRKEADNQLTSQADAPLQLVARPAPAPGDMVYIIKPGDTLSRLAESNNTTWETLAQYNQIADPNRIDPGFELYIPANEPTSTPDTSQPTSTPQPTDTSQPTSTPQPTDTPQPTSTPQPTDTSQPTSTPQPTNTPDTSQPTDTPQSAYTPPANTPQTTNTPPPPANTPAPANDVVPQHNTTNPFLYGQCTWWASQRYHELTGYFVPWTTNSNANQWTARANDFGWHVSDQPSVGAIIDFQAGVQLASDVGHVAIVEQILNDGTLITSNMNIIGHALGEVVNLKNYAGPGVTFITYK